MKEKHGIRLGTVLFLVVATALISMTGTYFYVSSLVNNIGESQQMYLELSNVEQIVVQNYVGSINATTDYDAMQNGIISGYVDGIGDEYSYYLTAKDYKSPAVSSTAIGSGIHIGYDLSTGCIKVRAVSVGSPADVAGVQTNDVILTIDGISITEMGYKTAVSRLSAEADATVAVTVLRAGSSDLLTFKLYYTDYESHTVDHEVLESGYGYIKINEFNESTLAAVKTACTELKEVNLVTGLVIDVRGNADGDYDSMIKVADYLIGASTICHRKQAKASETVIYASDADSLSLPFVVLQDSSTSGAAELFCAAVAENNMAVTIGKTTAGCARVQSEFALSDGSCLVLSVYEYLTPSGKTVEGAGVVPKTEVTDTEEGVDLILQRAVEALGE